MILTLRLVLQCAAGNAHHLASVSLRRAQARSCLNNCLTKLIGRQAFGFKMIQALLEDQLVRLCVAMIFFDRSHPQHDMLRGSIEA